MTTPAMQLISRIIDTGCYPTVQEWGIGGEDMLTSEEKGMWNMLTGKFHDVQTARSIPGTNALKHLYPAFIACDDPKMTTEALCYEARKEAVRKNAKKAADDLIRSVDHGDPVEALQLLHSRTARLLSYGYKTQDLTIQQTYESVRIEYEQKMAGINTCKIAWPWKLMQEKTGGIQEDDFIVFYGRPKSMKSWILCYLIATAYEMGNNVLVYTKEMTPVNISKRIIACHQHLPYQDLRLGQLNEHDLREFNDFAHVLQANAGKNRLDILSGMDLHQSGGSDTVAWLQSKIDTYKPDIVFVDGLYLMAPSTKVTQDWLRVTQISRDIRQMQLRMKLPVIATMQANRKAAGHKNAELDEIAYSDAVGQDATGLFRVVNEKNSPTIALVAGGNREYELVGLRVYGIPGTNFCEKEELREGELEEIEKKDTNPVAAAAKTRPKGAKKAEVPESILKENNAALVAQLKDTPRIEDDPIDEGEPEEDYADVA